MARSAAPPAAATSRLSDHVRTEPGAQVGQVERPDDRPPRHPGPQARPFDADPGEPAVVEEGTEGPQDGHEGERAIEDELDELTACLGRGETGQTDAGQHDERQHPGQDRRPDGPASQIRDAARPERGPCRGGPRREGAAGHDESQDPRTGRCPGGGVERGDREQHDTGVADDRVADDVLDVVLDPGRQGREQDRGDGHGQDHEPDRGEVERQRRDRGVRPGECDDRQGRGAEGGDQRQRRLGHGVREPGRPGMERDRPEPDRHGQGEREIRQAEHDGLRGKLAQVASDPGRRRDRHRARDGGGAQDPRPDRRARTTAERREGDERAERATGRRRDDRDARIRDGQREGRAREDAERHGRRVALVAGGLADDGQQQPHDRTEHEEEAQVVGRGEAALVDDDGLARPDREGRHDRRQQRHDPDAGREAVTAPERQGGDRPDAGDEQERQEAHRRVSGCRGDARRARAGGAPVPRG